MKNCFGAYKGFYQIFLFFHKHKMPLFIYTQQILKHYYLKILLLGHVSEITHFASFSPLKVRDTVHRKKKKKNPSPPTIDPYLKKYSKYSDTHTHLASFARNIYFTRSFLPSVSFFSFSPKN